MTGYVADPDRLSDHPVGSVLIEDGENRLVVVWGVSVLFEGDTQVCTYADPDATIEEIAAPEDSWWTAASSADEIVALVMALPVGSVVTETEHSGRTHTFVVVWGTKPTVVFDNGMGNVVPYLIDDDDTASIRVVSVPSNPIYSTPRCGAVHEDSEDAKPAKCSMPEGHDPIPLDGSTYEHAAPEVGVWWNAIDASAQSARETEISRAYNAVTGADGEEWNPDLTLAALNTLWDAAQKDALR